MTADIESRKALGRKVKLILQLPEDDPYFYKDSHGEWSKVSKNEYFGGQYDVDTVSPSEVPRYFVQCWEQHENELKNTPSTSTPASKSTQKLGSTTSTERNPKSKVTAEIERGNSKESSIPKKRPFDSRPGDNSPRESSHSKKQHVEIPLAPKNSFSKFKFPRPKPIEKKNMEKESSIPLHLSPVKQRQSSSRERSVSTESSSNHRDFSPNNLKKKGPEKLAKSYRKRHDLADAVFSTTKKIQHQGTMFDYVRTQGKMIVEGKMEKLETRITPVAASGFLKIEDICKNSSFEGRQIFNFYKFVTATTNDRMVALDEEGNCVFCKVHLQMTQNALHNENKCPFIKCPCAQCYVAQRRSEMGL